MFAFKKCFAGLFAAACITSAPADPVTLTFNLPDLVPNVPVEIDGYYAGGTDARGVVGPNYGISFLPSSGGGGVNTTVGGGDALIDTINPPPPSGGNVLAFPLPAGGVDLPFIIDSAGTTYVSYDFLNPVVADGGGIGDLAISFATGQSVSGSITLTPLGSSGWTHEDVTFDQPVNQFSFLLIGGTNPNTYEFANLTMNAAPVPEPDSGTYGLVGLGLLGMCWVFRKREKAII